MTWNLRLVDVTDPEFPDDKCIEICEVYYDQMGKPLGYSAASMSGEDVQEIRKYLMWALEALEKPILNFKDKHGYHGENNKGK